MQSLFFTSPAVFFFSLSSFFVDAEFRYDSDIQPTYLVCSDATGDQSMLLAAKSNCFHRCTNQYYLKMIVAVLLFLFHVAASLVSWFGSGSMQRQQIATERAPFQIMIRVYHIVVMEGKKLRANRWKRGRSRKCKLRKTKYSLAIVEWLFSQVIQLSIDAYKYTREEKKTRK